MDNIQKHDRLIVLISEAMELSKDNLYYENPDSVAQANRKALSDRLQEMDLLLKDLGECPMCGQEIGGVEKAEADVQALEAELFPLRNENEILEWEAAHREDRREDETPELDPLRRFADDGTYYNALIEVTTVDGFYNHSVGQVNTIGQAAETAYNLYEAGVDDTDEIFKNPPLSDAVKITLTITKEVY